MYYIAIEQWKVCNFLKENPGPLKMEPTGARNVGKELPLLHV